MRSHSMATRWRLNITRISWFLKQIVEFRSLTATVHVKSCQLENTEQDSSICSASWFSQLTNAELLIYKNEWEKGKNVKKKRKRERQVSAWHCWNQRVSVTPQMAEGGWKWVWSDQLNPSNPQCLPPPVLTHLDCVTHTHTHTHTDYWLTHKPIKLWSRSSLSLFYCAKPEHIWSRRNSNINPQIEFYMYSVTLIA